MNISIYVYIWYLPSACKNDALNFSLFEIKKSKTLIWAPFIDQFFIFFNLCKNQELIQTLPSCWPPHVTNHDLLASACRSSFSLICMHEDRMSLIRFLLRSSIKMFQAGACMVLGFFLIRSAVEISSEIFTSLCITCLIISKQFSTSVISLMYRISPERTGSRLSQSVFESTWS